MTRRHSYARLSVKLPKILPAVLLLVGGMSPACVKIDGGAVEISWVVRSTVGAAITDCTCADPPIASVRLLLVGRMGSVEGTTPCADQARCDFPCQKQTGSTAFDIEPTEGVERYEISVVAVGLDGQPIPLETVMTPAPILREVVRGQPTEVEAFQLVAPCRAACGMNGSGVCARP
jgi:hypothetical protein